MVCGGIIYMWSFSYLFMLPVVWFIGSHRYQISLIILPPHQLCFMGPECFYLHTNTELETRFQFRDMKFRQDSEWFKLKQIISIDQNKPDASFWGLELVQILKYSHIFLYFFILRCLHQNIPDFSCRHCGHKPIEWGKKHTHKILFLNFWMNHS